MGFFDTLKAMMTMPPAESYLPAVETARPVETRSMGGSWQYPPGWALSASMGPLVHGPGVYPWGQRQFVGDAASNSVVYACLRAIARAYVEAPLRHYKGAGDDKTHQESSPLTELLARPNPHFSLRVIEQWTEFVLHVHGNAYWRKLRAGDARTGPVVQLWPISPFVCRPMTEEGSTNFIDYYEYRLSETQKIPIPAEDIVHFRVGLDDNDHRMGLSPLRQLVREVASDREALRWAGALLANGARPGGLVVPAPEAKLTREEAIDLKDLINEQFGGDNLGKIGVLNVGGKFERMVYTPEEMDLTTIHRIPETRITGVLGVPGGLIGTASGLERNTYSNAREMREAFYEGTIAPLYWDNAATLNMQLVPDLTARPDEYLEYDIGELRAFQEDENSKSERIVVQFEKKIITLNEARGELGYPPMPEPEADQIAAPQPPPDVGQGDEGDADEGEGATPEERRRRLARKARRVTIADLPGLMDEVRDALQPQAVVNFRAYQADQARRVLREAGD